MPFYKEETGTPSSDIACPGIPSWHRKNESEGAWVGNTKQGTDKAPLSPSPEESMETKPKGREHNPANLAHMLQMPNMADGLARPGPWLQTSCQAGAGS